MMPSSTQIRRPQLRSVESAEPRVRVPERIADLLAEKLPEDQIEGLLPRQATIVLFGDAQAGKTFLALDMAACIATGQSFDGRATKPGSVLYVIAEGHGGFGKRIRALIHKFPDLPSAPFRVVRQAINLRADREDLLLRARDLSDDAGDLGLVVIDTLSQTLHGDENSPDMADYVASAGWLAGELGCPVLIGHHRGKDVGRGMRGSSALRGNVDVAIHLRADDLGNRTGTTDPEQGGKSRDDEPVTFGFRLRTVQTGRTASGRETSSCILEYQAAAVGGATSRRPLVGHAQKLVVELAADLAKVSSRYLADGTPLVARNDLEAAWTAAKKATGNSKQAAPSYLSRPLQAVIEAGWLAGAGADGTDLWFAR